MRRKMTITLADDVYRGLHRSVRHGEISCFIENLVRPHVVTDDDLEAAYREAATDSEAEREALEWIEAGLTRESSPYREASARKTGGPAGWESG